MTARPRSPDARRRSFAVSAWLHLARRFFGFVSARPLSPREQAEVSGLLTEAEAALFWRQRYEDQRHGLDVARRVLRALPGDREVAAAALLHDVGKIGVRIGATGRSLATLFSKVGLPRPRAYRAYLDHGRLGATALEDVGSARLAVAFARHHPGPAPASVDPDRWQALLDADHG